MNKINALGRLSHYFRSHNIPYKLGIDKEFNYLASFFKAERAPSHCIEATFWFYDDGIEARIHYSELGSSLCKDSANKESLYRLMNYINASLFLKATDGYSNRLYKPHMLYTPRFYVTEDDCFDITMTTIIDYDFYELSPLETADYLTMFCPSILNELSYPIFLLLLGKMEIDEAIECIEENLFKNVA